MASSGQGITGNRFCFTSRMRQLCRQRGGSAALEFALISPMFFGLLFSIMETGLIFLRSNAIDAGVEEAKRVTMTGQVAGAGVPLDLFKNAFCDKAGWIVNCTDVKFDVSSSKLWANTISNPVQGGTFNTAGLQFKPGAPCEIVVIRAFYEVPSLAGYIRNDVSNLSNGNIVLAGTAVFKNEPFGAC